MKVRLALDLDGTLVDSFSYWQTLAYREGVQDPFDHQYNGIYKVRCSDGEILANKLFGQYRDEWIADARPFPDVSEFIDRVESNKHMKYWIVTSRGEDVREGTLEWLARNGIEGYEDVIFTSNKLEAPCNTIVDDKPSHIKAYQSNARLGYLLSRSYNLNEQVARRADDLDEIYQSLMTFL